MSSRHRYEEHPLIIVKGFSKIQRELVQIIEMTFQVVNADKQAMFAEFIFATLTSLKWNLPKEGELVTVGWVECVVLVSSAQIAQVH